VVNSVLLIGLGYHYVQGHRGGNTPIGYEPAVPKPVREDL